MRFDPRPDVAIAAMFGLALSPCVGAVAMSSPQWSWLCIAQGSKRMPRPSDAAPVGCHACTCPRVDDEDDAQG